MSFEGWLIFATFWLVFVTTPGPNAANCISNGMTYGFARSLWGVLAILTQAFAFLLLSAAGVTAVIAASPAAFTALQFLGAAVLIGLGLRGWLLAGVPPAPQSGGDGSIYWRALMIATINPKSVAGYLAAFSQFVQPDIPVGQQMAAIVPTALTLTCLSYCGYTALGAMLGRAAVGTVMNLWVRRGLAACLMAFGAMLGAATLGRA